MAKNPGVVLLEDLVDTSGAAEVLGVAPESVTRYRARGGFPDPIRVFGGAPVWTRAQIEDYQASRPGRGAGGGRPRKSAATADTAPAPAKAAKAAPKKRGPKVLRGAAARTMAERVKAQGGL